MKNILGIFIVSIVGLVACTTEPVPVATAQTLSSERGPASIEEFIMATDDKTLQDIRQLDDGLSANRTSAIKADIRKRLSQILTRIAAAYTMMNDFDRQLDEANKAGQPIDLHSNATYLRLQKMRTLIDTVEARMATVYVHLWKLALGTDPYLQKVTSANRRNRIVTGARSTLDYIHELLNEYSNDARILGVVHSQQLLDIVPQMLASDIKTSPASESDRALATTYQGLVSFISKVDARSEEVSKMSHNEFMDIMQNVKINDPEVKDVIERTPQTNVLVDGFKNKTGSDFGKNKWVLTFDDGPHKDNTMKIAAALADEGVKGEYFWLSKLVKTYPSIAKDIYDKGYGINDHSIDHADLTKLTEAKIKDEVSGSRDAIEKELHDKGATSFKVANFRCPYGACWAPKSKKVQQAIVDAGLTHIYWTVDSLDWQDKNIQSVLARVLKQMKGSGRGIILFHDIHPVAHNVLPLLFKEKYVKDNQVQWLGL